MSDLLPGCRPRSGFGRRERFPLLPEEENIRPLPRRFYRFDRARGASFEGTSSRGSRCGCLSIPLGASPMVVVEALASGVPVVGYRVGGLEEQIQDGETGF